MRFAPDANVRHAPVAASRAGKNVSVLTNHKGLEITEDGFIVRIPPETLSMFLGKSVIVAVGQRANRSVAEELI